MALFTPPIVTFGDIAGFAPDGNPVTTAMSHFNANGFDYYLLSSDTAPQEFATVTGTTFNGVVGGFAGLNKSLTLDGERLYIGQALRVTFDNTTGVTDLDLTDMIVSDDDNRIQLNGQNRAPLSEAGVATEVVTGDDRSVSGFHTTNAGAGDTQMVLASPPTCSLAARAMTFCPAAPGPIRLPLARATMCWTAARAATTCAAMAVPTALSLPPMA